MIENYGDHIIYDVLTHRLTRDFPGAIVDVFDVEAGLRGFSTGENVFAIADLEARHLKAPYDAIVVTGGSVIHFETLVQKVEREGEKIPYPLWQLWAQASRVASKYGIALVWNNPEIPIDFTGWRGFAARSLIDPVDFLSVRDADSLRVLHELGFEHASLGPDTGWLLRQKFTDDAVALAVPPEISELEKVAVFHCNQRLFDSDLDGVIQVLRNVESQGFTVVLQALAYTNSEEVRLRELNSAAGGNFLYIDRQLSVGELVALFARCDLYIGLSFHGAITTASFGGEVVAFDYEQRRKTRHLYGAMGKASNYCTEIGELHAAVAEVLSRGPQLKVVAPQVQELARQAEHHFEILRESMVQPHLAEPKNIDELYELALVETSDRFAMQEQMRTLSDGYQECLRQYAELRRSVFGEE